MEPLAPWRIWTQLGVVGITLVLCCTCRLPFLRIVGCCMAVMIGYGIVQDQVTARLCPEYFTLGHPPIEGLTDPTLLGISWGFLGSWWGGLVLGLALAVCMRSGAAPPLPLNQFVWPLCLMLGGMAAVTTLGGIGTYYNAKLLGVSLGEPWASQIPPERHRGMLVVANAHFGTYGSGVVGGIAVCAWAVWKRGSTNGRTVCRVHSITR
jgi:hypothetical protein